MNNIKDYREKELKLFIIANTLLILGTSKVIFYNEATGSLDYAKIIVDFLNLSLISGFTSLATFLLDSMYSSSVKSKLLNFLGMISPPGEKIFSEIFSSCEDNRINKNDAIKAYDSIKKEIDCLDEKSKRKCENNRWYNIYHKHRDQAMIFASNRDYLLCRDIYIASVNIIVFYIAFSIIFKIISFSKVYLICILVLAIISNISAHWKAKRLVYNVIAYDLSEKSNIQ